MIWTREGMGVEAREGGSKGVLLSSLTSSPSAPALIHSVPATLASPYFLNQLGIPSFAWGSLCQWCSSTWNRVLHFSPSSAIFSLWPISTLHLVPHPFLPSSQHFWSLLMTTLFFQSTNPLLTLYAFTSDVYVCCLLLPTQEEFSSLFIDVSPSA